MGDGPVYASWPLTKILDYWQAVETSTLSRLPKLTPEGLAREMMINGSQGDQRFTVDGLLWHVLIHEMKHTAQIGILLRLQGIQPPFMDLLNYLPVHTNR